MTERERLIELIGDYTEDKSARDIHLAEFEEQFADYLLANGVIVLPIKVGDTVYYIRDSFIEPCTVKIIFLSNYMDKDGNSSKLL